jgi:quercetin dioxygenase-like cupin family protein
MKAGIIIAVVCALVGVGLSSSVLADDGHAETVAPRFNQAIPNVPGKSLVAVEVDYPPGAASPPHTHAKSAFIFAYVLSGRIESKVNDGETRIYKAGESWSEPPNAHHQVSRNASTTEPARLLAVFVVDTGDKTLTTPDARK